MEEVSLGLGLEVGDEVIHVNFKEVGQADRVLDRQVELLKKVHGRVQEGMLVEGQGLCIVGGQGHGDGLQWVAWESRVLGVVGSDVPGSFCGSTEVGWAVSPTHLQGSGYH